MTDRQRIFLILVLEYPTDEIAHQFQKVINQKYHLYKVLPEQHITLESIYFTDERDIELAKKIIGKNCRELQPFPITISGFACFGPPYKSVHLNVVKTEPLDQLYQRIHTDLKDNRLEVREYPEGVHFHITIASSCYPGRNWSEKEYLYVCSELKKIPVESGFILHSLELWYPKLDSQERLIERFNLKTFQP